MTERRLPDNSATPELAHLKLDSNEMNKRTIIVPFPSEEDRELGIRLVRMAAEDAMKEFQESKKYWNPNPADFLNTRTNT